MFSEKAFCTESKKTICAEGFIENKSEPNWEEQESTDIKSVGFQALKNILTYLLLEKSILDEERLNAWLNGEDPKLERFLDSQGVSNFSIALRKAFREVERHIPLRISNWSEADQDAFRNLAADWISSKKLNQSDHESALDKTQDIIDLQVISSRDLDEPVWEISPSFHIRSQTIQVMSPDRQFYEDKRILKFSDGKQIPVTEWLYRNKNEILGGFNDVAIFSSDLGPVLASIRQETGAIFELRLPGGEQPLYKLELGNTGQKIYISDIKCANGNGLYTLVKKFGCHVGCFNLTEGTGNLHEISKGFRTGEMKQIGNGEVILPSISCNHYARSVSFKLLRSSTGQWDETISVKLDNRTSFFSSGLATLELDGELYGFTLVDYGVSKSKRLVGTRLSKTDQSTAELPQSPHVQLQNFYLAIDSEYSDLKALEYFELRDEPYLLVVLKNGLLVIDLQSTSIHSHLPRETGDYLSKIVSFTTDDGRNLNAKFYTRTMSQGKSDYKEFVISLLSSQGPETAQ